MRDVWRIGVWMEVRLAGSQHPAPPDSEPLAAALAERWIRWAMAEGPPGRATLLDIAEALQGGFPSHRTGEDEALALVGRAFADGRLRAFAQKHEGGGKGPELDQPKSKPPPVKDDRTFIAVELLSDDPEPKPVPFKRYRITLPDQSVREGMLDQAGRALVTGIDPGTCKVTFPDFDAADWKAA